MDVKGKQSQHQQREARSTMKRGGVGLGGCGKNGQASRGGLYLTTERRLDGFTCVSRQGGCAFASGQERMCGRQKSANDAALPGAELQAAD